MVSRDSRGPRVNTDFKDPRGAKKRMMSRFQAIKLLENAGAWQDGGLRRRYAKESDTRGKGQKGDLHMLNFVFMKLSVGILGATGLTGVELVRLLLRHPGVEIAWLSSESQAGAAYAAVYPALEGRLPAAVATLISMADAREASQKNAPDAVFSCLPHAASAEAVEPFLNNGKTKVIDLSADYRLSDASVYNKTYAHAHPNPERLKEAVYGLTEIHRDKIAKARLVANPGCYPTSILLPLIPLLRGGVIARDGIIADSKSGVSGAGRKATEGTHYYFVNESFSAYKVGDTHRHLPEIAEQLSAASGHSVAPLFTPHLVPMERGILSTIYADLAPGKTAADAEAAWNKAYAGSPFVRPVKEFPKTADVARSNECRFKAYQPAGTNKLIVVSVLDNMVKGASGQALQNFNVMFGIEETEGLL
jgi:N-acetyl-gamma-glutamyl-phosphate reductase